MDGLDSLIIDGLTSGECALIGAIIRSALIDYLREIPPITDDMKESKKSEIKRMCKDKGTARAFFMRSKLFLMTGLNLEYLVDAYKRGLIANETD